MDLVDVKDHSSFLTKEEWEYCWFNEKIDVSEISKLGIVSVKRG